MNKETLDKAINLANKIRRNEYELEELNKFDIQERKDVKLGTKCYFQADTVLLRKIVDIAIGDKKAQIEEWEKELEEL